MNIFVKNVYVCVAFSLHTNLAVIELTWANPGFSLCACASVLGVGVGGGGGVGVALWINLLIFFNK